MESNLERSVAEQEKFQYYWTALTFTLLAAAVQSADMENYHAVTYALEVIGWICLLISGLQLLRYLEARGQNMRSLGFVEEYKKNNNLGDSLLEQLETIEVDARGSRNKMQYVYKYARYAFVIGLSLVIAARSIHGLSLLLS